MVAKELSLRFCQQLEGVAGDFGGRKWPSPRESGGGDARHSCRIAEQLTDGRHEACTCQIVLFEEYGCPGGIERPTVRQLVVGCGSRQRNDNGRESPGGYVGEGRSASPGHNQIGGGPGFGHGIDEGRQLTADG